MLIGFALLYVHGMHAAEAILTAKGGMTSHAALVARGWGKCCIVGCSELNINVREKKLEVNGKVLSEGDLLTLNGSKGRVYEGTIDLIEPDAQFSAGRFGEEARKAIAQVQKKGKTALLVGGSGLYLKAVVDGLFCGPKASAERREGLRKEAKAFGTASLHQRLKKVAPQAASKIHPHDLVRIIRALEVYEETGKCISSLQSQEKANGEIRCLIMIGLDRDRRDLYRRIDQRVESMFSRGLVEEVNDLLRRGYHENLASMQGLGYKEVCGYLKGNYDLEEAERLLKRNTRRYAKRKRTWFQRDERIHWIKVNEDEDEKETLGKIKKALVNTGLTM